MSESQPVRDLHYKTQIEVEQAIAFGHTDGWIIARCGVTAGQVRDVRCFLAQISHHVDQTDEVARAARRTTERTA